MTDDERDPPRHVRNEAVTRARFPQPNPYPEGLHPAAATAWCGDIADNQWFFMDASHVLLYLANGAGATTPCPKCLAALRMVIDHEIGDQIEEHTKRIATDAGLRWHELDAQDQAELCAMVHTLLNHMQLFGSDGDECVVDGRPRAAPPPPTAAECGGLAAARDLVAAMLDRAEHNGNRGSAAFDGLGEAVAYLDRLLIWAREVAS